MQIITSNKSILALNIHVTFLFFFFFSFFFCSLYIYLRNSTGPKTEPCGTPESTDTEDDFSSRTTLWDLPPRKVHEQRH